MQSSDGKYYKTDVADIEQLFRLIQTKLNVKHFDNPELNDDKHEK